MGQVASRYVSEQEQDGAFSRHIEYNYLSLLAEAKNCMADSFAEGVDPDDLLHSALMRARKVFHTFDPEITSLALWMRPILRRRRECYERIAAHEEGAVREYLDSAEQEKARDLSKQMRRAVSRAYGSIPAMYRRATVMVILGGRDVRDVATDLGTDTKTIDFYVEKGRQALQDDEELAALWKDFNGR